VSILTSADHHPTHVRGEVPRLVMPQRAEHDRQSSNGAFRPPNPLSQYSGLPHATRTRSHTYPIGASHPSTGTAPDAAIYRSTPLFSAPPYQPIPPRPIPHDRHPKHHSTHRTSSITSTLTKRQIISCFPCRERKLKCDGMKPCQPCTRRGAAEGCAYAEGVRRRGKGKKREHVNGEWIASLRMVRLKVGGVG